MTDLSSLFDTLSLNSQGSGGGSQGSSDEGSTDSLLSYSSGSAATYAFLTGGHGGGSAKLEVYQGLLMEFGICDFEDVPGSIKKCKDLIRANIHINIKSYLKVKRENGSAIGQVKLYRSRKALAQSLRDTRDIVKLSVAKKEFLNPLLVFV